MTDDKQPSSASAASKRTRKQTSPDGDAVIKADSPSPNFKRRKVISGKSAIDDVDPPADGTAQNGSPQEASQDAAGASNRNLPRLPIEIWLNIFGFLPRRDTETLSAVSRVSKAFHRGISPLLYQQVTATAPSRPNAQGFVKSLEPFLSVNQLKAVHTHTARLHYLERREEFPVVNDEHAVPYCAQYVKRLLVKWTNPCGEHLPVFGLFIEKLLANLTNLEAILWDDAFIVLTPEMGARIAALNLKAFAFHFGAPHEPIALQGIKHLSYLDIHLPKDYEHGLSVQDLIWESHETLQTLIYDENGGKDDEISIDHLLNRGGTTITFPKLTHLCIHPVFLDESDAARLVSAINFAQLTYLELCVRGCPSRYAEEPEETYDISHVNLFRALQNKYCQGAGQEQLTLKTFRFRSYTPAYPDENLLSLLSSFNTLETFIFEQRQPLSVHTNEEDPTALIGALGGHRRLRWFGINIFARGTGRWAVSTENLVKIRDSFPDLRHLSCTFADDERREFLGVLPTFPKLNCYHIPESILTKTSLLSEHIIPPFLRQMQDGSRGKRYETWEQRYSLNLVVLGSLPYQIVSQSPQTQKAKGFLMRRKLESQRIRCAGNTVYYRPLPMEQVFDGEYPDFTFLAAHEWRTRNYNGTRDDWLQGIKI
ncbi:hypothetical protein ABW21_db0200505 [Orbilia brochopaga]|nr:hypothetical protein ABW21_db0200505 [Drechslerella brochopaga]